MNQVKRKEREVEEIVELLDVRLLESGGDPTAAWMNLREDEIEVIDQEIERSLDFRYYAENYHTIKSEAEGLKTLYPFWESQEIIYGVVVRLRLAGGQVKIVVLKARQLGSCLDPETPVLTADLRWVPISLIKPGDRVVSTDEFPSHGQGAARKMRTAVVLETAVRILPRFRIALSNGTQLVASGDHRFLARRRGGVDTQWRKVSQFKVGEPFRVVTKRWGEPTYEDGWFSGFADGEGCLRRKDRAGVELSVSQVDNGAWHRALQYLADNGYPFRIEEDRRVPGESSKLGTKIVRKAVVGNMFDLFRLIGRCRPSRFLGQEWWEGKELPGKSRSSEDAWVDVVSIEPVGTGPLIDLQTSTGTFIADGVVSHNSTLSEALVFHRTVFTEGINTLVVAQDPGQADYLFEMSRLAYEMMPWWMRPEWRYDQKGRFLVFDRRDEMTRMISPGLRSQIFVEAANKFTGVAVGKTIFAAHLSEISLWEDAETLTEHIFPTMNAPDELAIAESTARGRKDVWHHLWKAAESGEIDWKPVFVPFFRVPKYSTPLPPGTTLSVTDEEKGIRQKVLEEQGFWVRDEQFNWRRQTMATFRALGREHKYFQEYPGTSPNEAFQASALCAFNRARLQEQLERCSCPPVWVGDIDLDDAKKVSLRIQKVPKGSRAPEAKGPGTRLWVWEEPEPDAQYYIGGDVAYGIEGGDFSCAEILKRGMGMNPDVQVAEWHGYISPTPFARVLAALGYWYNEAELAPECNDVGKTTAHELIRILEYPNLYRWKHLDKLKNYITDWFGWETNSKSRGFMISKMREAIDERTVILRSEALIDEMFDFSREEDETRFEGKGTKDDRVMASMIAHYIAHEMEWTEGGGKRKRRDDPEKDANRDFANTDFSPAYDRQEPSEAWMNDIPVGEARPEVTTEETHEDAALWAETRTGDEWMNS